MSNQAAYLTAVAQPLTLNKAPYPNIGEDDVLIKNGALAVNPVDWKMQDYGLFIKEYPVILGCDVAGEVVDVGKSVQNVKKGDRVLGHAISLAAGDQKYAGFQHFTVAPSTLVSKIPASVSFEEGAVLPLAMSTASAGLFQKENLGLQLPSLDAKPGSKGAVLIWSGSSSVGSTAIQLAYNAGYEVLTTASPRNFDYVKSLGASHAFDYKSESVVKDIGAALQGKTLEGTYDCVSEGNSIQLCIEIVRAAKGDKKLAVILPGADQGLPSDIKASAVFAPTIKDNEVGPGVYHKFLPQALEQGKLKPKPDPTVVGKGLESLQKGMDKSRQGVSAAKIVVTL